MTPPTPQPPFPTGYWLYRVFFTPAVVQELTSQKFFVRIFSEDQVPHRPDFGPFETKREASSWMFECRDHALTIHPGGKRNKLFDPNTTPNLHGIALPHKAWLKNVKAEPIEGYGWLVKPYTVGYDETHFYIETPNNRDIGPFTSPDKAREFVAWAINYQPVSTTPTPTPPL